MDHAAPSTPLRPGRMSGLYNTMTSEMEQAGQELGESTSPLLEAAAGLPEPRMLLGRYQLGAELARGAQGVVRRAVDTVTNEFVAVKEVR